MKKVEIYTDGAAKGNPGPGGFGTVVKYEDGTRKEFSRGVRLTTSNRMEILAVIIGLESLSEKSDVTIKSDSQYVVNSVNKRWLNNWKKNNWINHQGDKVKNRDLWERFLTAKAKHKTKFIWVKGHAGLTENERCDKLATTAAADTEHHVIDEVYENLAASER